ncbi:RluA family pseudouridine synthase [Henriciella aquimarina]|uniref:RluA family pseudouridine synthase n=1 Tax=Henriciella aquimarina TaxID=545261 RepID=UPI000A073019|nr:RluA family pseudouridine synthase [Henriciella aquimarina]
MTSGGLPDRPYTPPDETTLGLVHEDPLFLAADKPSGLLSVPGRGAGKTASALTYLEQRYGPLHVVHRLDMDTSGLILFARSLEAARALSRLFQSRDVTKTYYAVVHGQPGREAGEITLPIGRDWAERPKRRIDRERGKPALTHWQVEARLRDATCLQLQPHTGRTHQLRLHLSAIGHPILGDRLYGQPDAADRLLLHASGLSFRHPDSGETVDIKAPPAFPEWAQSEK